MSTVHTEKSTKTEAKTVFQELVREHIKRGKTGWCTVQTLQSELTQNAAQISRQLKKKSLKDDSC